MNDINFTTFDVNAIVNYIKGIINTKGYNYNITEKDILNIPHDQLYAINKLRQKFGNNYLDNINKILNKYIIFKGGKSTLAPDPKSSSTKVSPYFGTFLKGVAGTQTKKSESGTAEALGTLTRQFGQTFGEKLL